MKKLNSDYYEDLIGVQFSNEKNCSWVARTVLSRMGFVIPDGVLPTKQSGVFVAKEAADKGEGIKKVANQIRKADFPGSIVLTFDEEFQTHHVYVGLGGGWMITSINPSGCRIFSIAAAERLSSEVLGVYMLTHRTSQAKEASK